MEAAGTSEILIPPMKLHGLFSFMVYFTHCQYLDHIALNAGMINELEGTVMAKSRYYPGMSGGNE
jgi:hypothetical protein